MRLISYSAVSVILSFLFFTSYALLNNLENEFLYQFGTFAVTLFSFLFGIPMLWIASRHSLPLRLLIYLTTLALSILLFIGGYQTFAASSLDIQLNLSGIIRFALIACLLYVIPYEVCIKRLKQPSIST
ncbi:hypothetical protein [Exiguobacterium oxidotolerans]|uniref:hypothetical protein n=1 Tax=Exiguobacterium oxidotolerans TaxID=223958 RepID=UPI0004941E7D|nr:hypothetical protein [Exiguobacterium oxidotolerans]